MQLAGIELKGLAFNNVYLMKAQLF